MQKRIDITTWTRITPVAGISLKAHGGRAKCLQRLIRMDLPVPETLALSFSAVQAIAQGQMPDSRGMIAELDGLVSVRPSSEDPDWGGPGAMLNIGMNDARHREFRSCLGADAADALYVRFIQAYALNVARLDPEMFETDNAQVLTPAAALRAWQRETEQPFPQEPDVQLTEVLRSMARAWSGTSARLLRTARGAPADAGLGLVVQRMAMGLGQVESGAGVIQFVDGNLGQPQITGRYRSQAQGRDALEGGEGAYFLTHDSRGPSLEALCPQAFVDLIRFGDLCRIRLREEMQIEFTLDHDRLYILDAVRVARTTRAALQIAVRLAEDGVIAREDAVLRIPPRALSELLHKQVSPAGPRDVAARGIPASPGGAVGRVVFSSAAAQTSAAQGEPCILIRRETTPEDIRGMHVAAGVLTERGGMTSHAAVIARGLGLPCIVGASGLRLNPRDHSARTAEGRTLREGDVITLDGTRGEVLIGAARMLDPALDDAFRSLLGWADEVRDIGVRANADTPADAQTARMFRAEGIGLCRTEHMFFDADRLTVMREMIFAATPEDRRAVLARLLPMQRADFTRLFGIMHGLPVCIRLFDPPLHEFLPSDRDGVRDLAEALALPVADVAARVDELTEFNPMLGMRGVRLGIVLPEIYEMQARAIFEATLDASAEGEPVVPEIMIPLISARREVELVKSRIDAVAAEVRNARRADFDYRLGVMVETPRAALRAGEIAQHAEFLSFGTNDLTQMTYGLSRDDAGRFMGAYVQQGVFAEDPFHTLDTEGVGELLQIGAERGRAARPGVTISLCGEHGGNPESIAFCRAAGFDYVSCSPYRVPIARLAAAQLALQDRRSPAAEPATD